MFFVNIIIGKRLKRVGRNNNFCWCNKMIFLERKVKMALYSLQDNENERVVIGKVMVTNNIIDTVSLLQQRLKNEGLRDGGRLHLRVSPEEKEMIRSKAEAEKMTMSSLILNTLDKIDNPITVNLDDSDLRDLLIQVRRINVNVRTFLKQVGTGEHFTIEDRQEMEQQLVSNEKFVLDEYKRVRELVSKIESMNTEEAAEFAKKVINNNLESVNDIEGHFE